MRLIDADALKELYMPYGGCGFDEDSKVPIGAILANIDDMPTASPWVSVKDRLPEENCTVIVAYWDGTIGDDIFDSTARRFYDCDVTHWLEVPKPPKFPSGGSLEEKKKSSPG